MKGYLRLLVFLSLVSVLALNLAGCGGDADAQIFIDGQDPDVVIVTCDDTNLRVLTGSPSNFSGISNNIGEACAGVIEDLVEDEGLRIEAVTAFGGGSGSGILVYTLVDINFP